jgi:hypothetical protein
MATFLSNGPKWEVEVVGDFVEQGFQKKRRHAAWTQGLFRAKGFGCS